MNTLNLADNLISLRRTHGVTQEDLASFLGVTKASVSKWETRTSYPDILLLPQIASYFDVSVDELLGYEAQMSPQQIDAAYLKFTESFTTRPCEEVFNESRALIRKYYSDYRFLFQMLTLWINHYNLLSGKEKQMELIVEMESLCRHILESCKDVNLCNNTLSIHALIQLMLGKPQEVIEALEPAFENTMMNLQSDATLIQAYNMTGNLEKADYCNQINIYTHLLGLISNSINYIFVHLKEKQPSEMTLERLRTVIDAYEVEKLHPNTALQYHFVCALFHAEHQETDAALASLTHFVDGSISFVKSDLTLHGDEYFTKVTEWFENNSCQTNLPRSPKLILESLLPSMQHPVLLALSELPEYRLLVQRINNELDIMTGTCNQ